MTKEELDLELFLERAKNGREMFAQLSKAELDFSAKAIQGAFILNGGAATAVLATKDPTYICHIWILAIGAFLAVVAMAFAYFCNYNYGETWRPFVEVIKNPGEYTNKYITIANRWKFAAVLSLIGSLTAFVVAVCILCTSVKWC